MTVIILQLERYFNLSTSHVDIEVNVFGDIDTDDVILKPLNE